MIHRSAVLLASLLCLPSLASAQAPAGPLAAPALPHAAAPAFAPDRDALRAMPLPLSAEAQEPLEKSRLVKSVPLATVLGLGGLIVGIIRFAAFQHAARSGDDG